MTTPHALLLAREDTGALTEALCTASGILKTETAGGLMPPTSTVVSPTFVIQLAVSSVPFRLRYLRFYSKGTGLIAIVNKASAVVNGDAPYPSFMASVSGGVSGEFPLPPTGLDLSAGCQIAFITGFGASPTPSITLGTDNIMVFAQGDVL